MVKRASRALVAVLVLAALLLVACGDDSAPATGEAPATSTATPTVATATPSPTATATATAALEISAGAERAFEHLRVLAIDIGERFAGTDGEREAAAYVAAQFEAAGYSVTIEEFEAQIQINDATIEIEGEGDPIRAFPLAESPSGEASGRLVFAGLGEFADFEGLDVEGAIVLLDRGVVTFALQAVNAEESGAAGVIVINNEPGELYGTLGRGTGIAIPVVGVAGHPGSPLRALAEAGAEATLRSDIGSDVRTSQNVVGRPEDGECRAYLGAHYDSVPDTEGANDNASGTGLLIELARVASGEEFGDGLCFIAFGAEEVGLFGSRAFVQAHDVSEAAFMLNFDMVARIGQRTGDGPRFIAGDIALADLAAAVAGELGYGIPRGSFPANASSDHASFSEAGVPAITVHSGGAEFIHTPRDTLETVFIEDLAIFLDVSIALLERLFEEQTQ
ncbi:MAG: M28 family peptidase [Chloroflexi bacterium]|nr:M28 family peptidase [Chloroflexota bacterium]